MKIIVDDKIPYIREKLDLLADDVVYLRGADISAEDVRDADALIVRTRTRCDRQLLEGSKVQFVATATIGFDHIDINYMAEAGITWTNCPGCNAGSVAQYLECSLLLLQQKKGLVLHDATIGIVGCGHVGSKVKAVAERLGMRILVCDPPLEQTITHHPSPITQHPTPITHHPTPNTHHPSPITFAPLDVIEREADIITFHVPLTREGQYATYHMADNDFFHRLSRVPYIINTSRGEVVDNVALFQALEEGRVRDAILDVWEGEPNVNLNLLNRVFIGTPHIAGYSADGKVNADNMVIDALCQHFGLSHPGRILPPPLPTDLALSQSALDYYNPLIDSEKLKNNPSTFEILRNNYPIRREQF